MKEQANISADGMVSAESADTDHRAADLKETLTRRLNFYKGLAGRYSGTETIGSDFDFELTLTPQGLPTEGATQKEELADDLSKLSFTATVLIADPGHLVNVACSFTNVIPDWESGRIELPMVNCAQGFTLWIMDPTTDPAQSARRFSAGIQLRSAEMSRSLQAGKTPGTLNLFVQARTQNGGYAEFPGTPAPAGR